MNKSRRPAICMLRRMMLLSLLVNSTITAIGGKTEKKSYADNGILELYGRVSGSYSSAFTQNSPVGYNVDFFPGLNYFLFKSWYLGAGLGLQHIYYNNWQSPATSETNILADASLGYATALTEKLFWFAETGFSYLTLTCSACSSSGSQSMIYNLGSGVKFDFGGGLITSALRLSQSGHTRIALVVGFSVYF